MHQDTGHSPGYTYGQATVMPSTISMEDLIQLKASAMFTEEDERYLRLAGDVLNDQTAQIVDLWRKDIISSIPNLARHSRDQQGRPLPEYLEATNMRFRQWILDTCRRSYDDAWLRYQQEIARRHTSAGKNVTDGVPSTSHVPLRDVIAFVAVMNETLRPFLAKQGHSESAVHAMHLAWQKSLQMQLAIWTKTYAECSGLPADW